MSYTWRKDGKKNQKGGDNMRKLLIALTISLFLMPLVLSASYVVGLVGNASDGTDANGYVITLWNTTAGVTDNRTDTIGVSGG